MDNLWIYTLWIYSLSTLENTDKNKLFRLFTTSILAKLSKYCFEHSDNNNCSLLVNPSHTDESWAGRITCLTIYVLWNYSLSTLENTNENKLFCLFTKSIMAKLNTWSFEQSGEISGSLTVHPSHTDEPWVGRNTRLRIYTFWIYSLSTLENTDEKKLLCLFTTSILAKLSTSCFKHSSDISWSLLVNPNHTDEFLTGRTTCLWLYTYIYDHE